MGKQDLANVLGRALLDQRFAAEVNSNPMQAAKSIGATLTTSESKALAGVDVAHLQAVSSLLRSKLPKAAVFDQQQQQARMD